MSTLPLIRPDDRAADLAPAAQSFVEYFRCPPELAALEAERPSAHAAARFFTFGDAIAWGRVAGTGPRSATSAPLMDADHAVRVSDGCLVLPFDLSEVATDLRQECYWRARGWRERTLGARAVERIYYLVRPALGVSVRRHMQRARLKGWERITFPRWPVDASVDTLMRETMRVLMKKLRVGRLPFVWFWPGGASACAMVTHDVESDEGARGCTALMDLNDSFGVKAAFQVVPAGRGRAALGLVDEFRRRGFEVNLHDLNHDGRLFADREAFLARAARINQHARTLGCRGFRSAAMYREQRWFDALEVDYDMSVPSAAHLEPQRGGCCTVMPYFVGRILELPLTTVQDYSLFHVLGDYSTRLWRRQIEEISARNGLITILTHPDYLGEPRARAVYAELLGEIARRRDDGRLWVAMPGEVDAWWRARSAMRVVRDGSGWRIEGPERRRARLAYALLEGGRLTFTFETRP